MTKPNNYFVARARDAEGLTALEIQQKYALPYKPDRIAKVELPERTTIYEGVAETFNLDSGEILQGGGWQVYIKKAKELEDLPMEWFIETNIGLK